MLDLDRLVRFEVFTAVTVKNTVFWDVGYWGMKMTTHEECHLLGCYAMWLL
jgi:hypothetical protein